MNDFCYSFNIDKETLDIVKKFFWDKLYPIHRSKNLPNRNGAGTQMVTYFPFYDISVPPEIEDFLNRFSMLTRECLINESLPMNGTKVHLDGMITSPNRMAAINFPIEGGNINSPTLFYGLPDKYPSFYDHNFQTTYLNPGVKPQICAQVCIIDQPALLNVKAWHSIKNNGTSRRIALSWTCKNNIDFRMARDMLINQLK